MEMHAKGFDHITAFETDWYRVSTADDIHQEFYTYGLTQKAVYIIFVCMFFELVRTKASQ